MKRRVVVVSSCAPPQAGLPVTGGGLRTLQLVETFEQAGHQVILMLERESLPEGAPASLLRRAFPAEALRSEVESRRPSVVVVEQWALAARLAGIDRPVVVDLHGSLMLENVYRRGGVELTLDAGTKIQALRAADLLLVPSSAQMAWFASWAAIAGFDPREPPLALLPLALPGDPAPPRDAPSPPLRMVYGGARWPWIDSFDPLCVAAEVAEATRGGRLDVFAFEPPRHGLPVEEALGTWPQVDRALRGRTKKGIRLHAGLAHEEFSQFLRREATVALDLWKPNPERLLAATTRTVEYLFAGLPVVTVQGATWAEELLSSGAGWALPPDDPDALAALLRRLAAEPSLIAQASLAATTLARDRHTLASSGRALLDFCDRPSCPPRTQDSLTGAVIAEREAWFRTALADERAALLAAHEARAEEQRQAHRQEIDDLSARHRALVDEVTEQHRRIVQDVTDRHRAEQAAILVERQREVGSMLVHWQGELDKARAALLDAESRHRQEIESVESRHRAERAEDEDRHRDEIQAQADQARAELAAARDDHRRDLAATDSGRSAALDQAEARHRREVEGLVQARRAEMAEAQECWQAERRLEQQERQAEMQAAVERHRSEMEAARRDRDLATRSLVDEWSGKAAELQRELTEARDRLGDALGRQEEAERRAAGQAARLAAELEAAGTARREAESSLDELRSRRRNRLPRLPRGPGQALRLAKLWVGHALDRE